MLTNRKTMTPRFAWRPWVLTYYLGKRNLHKFESYPSLEISPFLTHVIKNSGRSLKTGAGQKGRGFVTYHFTVKFGMEEIMRNNWVKTTLQRRRHYRRYDLL